MKGVLNFRKRRGMTSSDAVGRVRRILGTRAVGHMGTLDPAGEGVLLLGVGKATRLFDFYLHKDKVYEAEFAFGYTTDTLDGDGIVTERTTCVPDRQMLANVLPKFVGKLSQVPPAYSAKSVGGVRAYTLARKGKSVQLPPCDVEIYALECIEQTAEHTYKVRVHCSSGTYIRSLCRDVAGALGSLATMTSIVRTRCGEFGLEDSVTEERLAEVGETALVSVEDALSALPRYDLRSDVYTRLIGGIKPYAPDAPEGDFVLYCRDELFGIARKRDDILSVTCYLRD